MTRRSIAVTLSLLAVLLTAGVGLVRVLAAGEGGPGSSPRADKRFGQPVIDRDYFAAGPLVEISGTVNGDLYAAGGQVFIDGRVNGDILVAGSRVMILGQVAQNVRMAGGQVDLQRDRRPGMSRCSRGSGADPGRRGYGKPRGRSGRCSPRGSSWRRPNGGRREPHHLAPGRRGCGAAVGSLRIGSKADIKGHVAYVSQREASVDPRGKASKSR